MRQSPTVLALLVAIALAPLAAYADGARGGSRPPARRPGTTPFRVSVAAYMPRVSIEGVRRAGDLVLVDVAYRVRRGHVERVELLVDGEKVADIKVPGSSRSGTLTAKLGAAAIGEGAHSIVARAAQGRPGHQSKVRSSKPAKFTL